MKAYFDPKPDITAFELAWTMARVIPSTLVNLRKGVFFTQKQWEDVLPEMKRHWSLKPLDEEPPGDA